MPQECLVVQHPTADLLVRVEVPVCYPLPRASFRAWRGCSACPQKQHLWCLLEEDRASHSSREEPRKLRHKPEAGAWFPGISLLCNPSLNLTKVNPSPNLTKINWINLAFD